MWMCLLTLLAVTCDQQLACCQTCDTYCVASSVNLTYGCISIGPRLSYTATAKLMVQQGMSHASIPYHTVP